MVRIAPGFSEDLSASSTVLLFFRCTKGSAKVVLISGHENFWVFKKFFRDKEAFFGTQKAFFRDISFFQYKKVFFGIQKTFCGIQKFFRDTKGKMLTKIQKTSQKLKKYTNIQETEKEKNKRFFLILLFF